MFRIKEDIAGGRIYLEVLHFALDSLDMVLLVYVCICVVILCHQRHWSVID